ncbi:MAG: cache domain-containing protein [Deltaproteobacteria bacterium]|nr:cache domain-containing protein [Deltaproteobacteria bacterium]
MLGGSFVIFDVTASYYDFNHRATQMRTHYLTQQKQTFKREVDSVVNMINFEKMKSEELTRDKIKMRLYEAYAIARNIYQQNKSSNDEAEILRLINDALRPIRFDNGCGYYFATTLDGVELLFADKPQMEGLNLLNVRDAHGRYVIKDMIAIVKQSGEGFYEYYWSKPNVEGLHYKKISYVKRFESCNWFIGTGLYVDDVEGQIKKELLDRIASIRFGLNADGYIFVVAYDGTTLMNDT